MSFDWGSAIVAFIIFCFTWYMVQQRNVLVCMPSGWFVMGIRTNDYISIIIKKKVKSMYLLGEGRRSYVDALSNNTAEFTLLLNTIRDLQHKPAFLRSDLASTSKCLVSERNGRIQVATCFLAWCLVHWGCPVNWRLYVGRISYWSAFQRMKTRIFKFYFTFFSHIHFISLPQGQWRIFSSRLRLLDWHSVM